MSAHELTTAQAEWLLRKHRAVITSAEVAALKEAFRLGTQVDLMKVVHKERKK